MVLPDIFNLFDLFLRLMPGSVLITFLQIILQLDINQIPSVVLLFFYVSVSYTAGTMLYGVSKVIVTPVINIIVLGDKNPRCIYDKENTRQFGCSVIENHAIRNIAAKLNETYHDPEYLFDLMINTLEMKGYNEKEDRMESAATMSSSMCLVCILLFVICLFHKIRKAYLVCIIRIVGFAATYVVYTRIRYRTVVNTYWLLMKQEDHH